MPFISGKNLEIVKDLIQNRDVEVCGNLLTSAEADVYGVGRPVGDELVLYLETVGERSSCQNKTYAARMWHTHSKHSKGYPSASDIILPLRKRPDNSLIFTIWGIWEIFSREKYVNELSPERREYITDHYIQKVLDKIYKYTDGGRNPNIRTDYVRQLSESLVKVMRSLGYQIQIRFTPWSQVGTDNYELIG
jgi:hypothetical protein